MIVSGGLNWGLILMQMREWVLGKVLMSIVVCINGLRLKMCNGIKLLDNRSTETGQGSETVSNSMRSSCIKAWILCINDSFFPVAGWPASLNLSSHLGHCHLVLLLRLVLDRLGKEDSNSRKCVMTPEHPSTSIQMSWPLL